MKAQVHVWYPGAGVRLRTEADWDVDVLPIRVDGDLSEFELELPDALPGMYYKPVLLTPDGPRWAVGGNYVAGLESCQIYPCFHATSGRLERRHTVSAPDGTRRDVRVWLPPGYDENTRKRYPVLYANDGANVFLVEESFKGEEWELDETAQRLDAMAAIDKVIVVGVYAHKDRDDEYTATGWDRYARSLIDGVIPWVDTHYRTLPDARHRAIIGASLGGVVSFWLGWSRPDVFGNAACLSSTFGWRDDLVWQVVHGERRPVRFYLDSGWPHDNFDVTRRMADALVARGWVWGADVLFFGFPMADHSEKHWAARVHLVFQYFFGKAARASACPPSEPPLVAG